MFLPSRPSRLPLISVAYITQLSGHVLCGQTHARCFKILPTARKMCEKPFKAPSLSLSLKVVLKVYLNSSLQKSKAAVSF